MWGAKLTAARAHFNSGSGEIAERSEEHTSELQSRWQLVCRLLLEKKEPSRGDFLSHQLRDLVRGGAGLGSLPFVGVVGVFGRPFRFEASCHDDARYSAADAAPADEGVRHSSLLACS